ncbi:MAG TPA: hypothetical protein VGC41_09505 [Kofleriaceae bacterium]
MELRDNLELTAFRTAPGSLSPWVRAALVLACIATVALPFAGERMLYLQGGEATGIPKWIFNNALALVGLVGVAAIAMPSFYLSRFLRIAMLLPLVHVALIAIAWPVWTQLVAPKLDTVHRWYYLSTKLPISWFLVGELVVTSLAAYAISVRRRDTAWSHSFVMIALVDLPLVGLWLPVVAWMTCHGARDLEIDPSYALEHPRRLTVLVTVPPMVVAILYTTFAMRWPDRAKQLGLHTGGAIAALFAFAFVTRTDAPPAARVVYANFIHVLLAAQIVAAIAPTMFALGLWRNAAAIRKELASKARSITGVVVAPDREKVVACFEIAGWLRPPRPLVRSFSITTPDGELVVPGARLHAPLDPATTLLEPGESFGALRDGDWVTVSTVPTESAEGPFRSLATPLVAANPAVAPVSLPPVTFADLALALWRPAVAYLVILVALSAPALAALLAPFD